jgi:TBC1 domain family member 15
VNWRLLHKRSDNSHRLRSESFLVSEPPIPNGNQSSSSSSPLPSSGAALYAYSFPLSKLYSFVLSAPTFSNWYGTMVLSLLGGVALPMLHFHDDESQSTILGLERAKGKEKEDAVSLKSTASSSGANGSLQNGTAGGSQHQGNSPSPSSPCTWGGDELLNQLRRYAHVLRSVLQPNLFLVNPSRADMETHSTPIFEDDAIDAPSTGASNSGIHTHRSGINTHTNPSPADGGDAKMDPLVLWAKSTRLSFLSSFSQITKSARQATHQVLTHPLAKPYVGHLPGPVQSFAQAGPFPLGPISDAEWGRIAQQSGVGEYDSARVYLAKWARLVAEEGERNKRNEEASAAAADESKGDGTDGDMLREEHGQLGVFELLAKSADVPRPPTTRVQDSPITLQEWRSLFDSATGRPLQSEANMKARVFAHGLADLPTRKEAWPFLLGVVPWDCTAAEREKMWRSKESQYWELKKGWMNNPALLEREDVLEQRHRIRVDCLRTDRGHPMFRAAPALENKEGDANGEKLQQSPAFMSASIVQEKEAGHSSATSNDHVVRLGEILLTFGIWEDQSGKLGGYVQGMSDLCSLLYIVCDGDEVRTFWCFVGLMQRMAPNFYADQSGMTKQLLLLQKLIATMDPALYAHLDQAESLNLFFCFR